VRLCKGAYQEPPELAFPDKRDVDRAYGRLTERLFADDARRAGVYPGIATHDERLQRLAVATARARGVPADAWEIQMLFGIRADLHARLAGDGAPLRVLVPYGKDWYGYFMRRLAERPANVLFLLRNLLRV
jgi:proline dehydrogenase